MAAAICFGPAWTHRAGSVGARTAAPSSAVLEGRASPAYGVATAPGATAFRRMPLPAHAADAARQAKRASASLEAAPHGRHSGAPRRGPQAAASSPARHAVDQGRVQGRARSSPSRTRSRRRGGVATAGERVLRRPPSSSPAAPEAVDGHDLRGRLHPGAEPRAENQAVERARCRLTDPVDEAPARPPQSRDHGDHPPHPGRRSRSRRAPPPPAASGSPRRCPRAEPVIANRSHRVGAPFPPGSILGPRAAPRFDNRHLRAATVGIGMHQSIQEINEAVERASAWVETPPHRDRPYDRRPALICSSACSSALLADGHVLLEGVPGLAKTTRREDARGGDPGSLPPRPVHARPAARPTSIGTLIYNPQRRRRSSTQQRPDLREPHPRRRDQPRARQGAERAARGDAGAPGHDRRRDASAARAVPRAGDAEPDRAGGHLPAARGAGRPLHAEADRSTTRPREEERAILDRMAHLASAPVRSSAVVEPATMLERAPRRRPASTSTTR